VKNDELRQWYRRYGPTGPLGTQSVSSENGDSPSERSDARYSPRFPGMSRAEPVIAQKGEGAWLVDEEGKKLLDFANGGSVPIGYGLGTRSESSADSVMSHARSCPALGADGVLWRPEVELMRKLAELVPGGMNRRVLICESGREALARAIELARNETGRQGVVYLSEIAEGLGTRSDSSAESVMSRAAAVVAHPLDGRIRQARKACDAAGALLIDDEAGIGPGTTGRMLAVELLDVRPDVYVLGRGWAAGLPFGACVTGSSNLRWKCVPVGNPVGSAVALEVTRLLESGLLEQGRKLATHLEKRFARLSSTRLEPELCGVGLVRSIVFRKSRSVADGFAQKCRELGLLLASLGTSAVAVRPPLVSTQKDVDFAAEVIGKVLADFDKKE
jgi:4-aminobutyrate aminotransferase-like enzyme